MASILTATIGRNLARYRAIAELSRERLALASDVAVNTIGNLETGAANTVQIDTLEKLAVALRVDVHDLLYSDPPAPQELRASWEAFMAAGADATDDERRDLFASPALYRWGAPKPQTWALALAWLRSVKRGP